MLHFLKTTANFLVLQSSGISRYRFIQSMAKAVQCFAVMLFAISLLISHSEQLKSSQRETLLRIPRLLNNPPVLSSWNSSIDFCNTDPNPSVTVVCYDKSVTQLHIIGSKGAPLLPRNFSMEALVTTLGGLPNLKVLTLVSLGLWGPLPGKIARLSSLEILNVSSNFLYDAIPHEVSLLSGLQSLVLDDNMFAGTLPNWIGSFPVLTVLSLRKNMFNGSLPNPISKLDNLRVLALSDNYFHGEVPDLSSLANLQVLDMDDNSLGPHFPLLGHKLVSLVLSKNKFRDALPAEMNSYYQLQHLDLSNNKFVGRFPASLLSLPSISYLNIADNKFTGILLKNQSCNADLEFVDLSSNLLTGNLPKCLLSGSKKEVQYTGNCLATGDQNQQHPLYFCRNEALAVGFLPQQKKRKKSVKAFLIFGVTGGLLGGISLVGLIFWVVRKANERKTIKKPATRLIAEHASTGYPSKLLTDARYISQTMGLGALGLPAYRTFSLDELEEATNNFNTSAFMGEGSQGQMYKGRLKGGFSVAIRCVKMKGSHSIQNFMQHIELISKLRHRHLISALGHCFECYLDDSSVSRVFRIFEYVQNGTLRTWISGKHSAQTLQWTQRITAVIGVAKGIQFLHTGIVPGVYSNNLKITDILLDRNLVAKISSYNLPLLAENTAMGGNGLSSVGSKDKANNASANQDKSDIYDFGVILLEIIVGRPVTYKNEVDIIKDQLQTCITSDDARRSVIDPTVLKTCSDQSLKTVMEICIRCLLRNPADRPSVEDVLWNLQFAAQVQDAGRGDSQSSEGSPVSPLRRPHLRLIMQ